MQSLTRFIKRLSCCSKVKETLTFYVIFHQKNFPENIPDINCFVYLGANERVQKEIHPDTKHPIVYEYDTPSYNPIYQMLNFCDNSVILNIQPPPTHFIGICQYDMNINKENMILAMNSLNEPNSMVGFYDYHVETILDVLNEDDYNSMLDIYNAKFNTSHTIESLSDTPLFLLNTFIIPSYFFLHLQSTLKLLLPTVFKLLKYDMRHIAGTLERVNALIIACAIKEKALIHFFSDAITDVREQTAECIRINRD
jgi:hypothetical protein